MSHSSKRSDRSGPVRTSWDGVAAWYDGWVGKKGSVHHRKLAIPAVLELLDLRPGEKVLDVGAGQGVLCPYVVEAGARYTGVDASGRLLGLARRRHGRQGRFFRGDARRLSELPALGAGNFDAVVFLLSIQNMEPLQEVLDSASRALRTGARAVLLMTHPCFRPPRQSGWGWDGRRKLHYRRVDRYLSPFYLPEEIRAGKRRGRTFSFHRPLEAYVNGLAACDLLVERIVEVATSESSGKADGPVNPEIPLFLGLRARKVGECAVVRDSC